MAVINLESIRKADVTHDPFDFFAINSVLSDDDLKSAQADFPKIDRPGIFPLSELSYGPGFAKLVGEIQSPELAEAVGRKFGVELKGLPLMITVRGQAQAKDGRIHTDTKDKVVTCLLYLNETWDGGGGRLRMLRGPDDIENYAAEIPPNGGAFASFRVSDKSFHGHKPFVGDRRYVMFNWVKSDAALARQLGRHKFSARIKKLLPFFYRGSKEGY